MKKVYLIDVNYSLLELQQYFQLLGVSDHDFIPIEKIKRILVNENKSDLEIYDIIMSLKPFMEGDLLNYKKFVQQFF
jgi:hypothetical protein